MGDEIDGYARRLSRMNQVFEGPSPIGRLKHPQSVHPPPTGAHDFTDRIAATQPLMRIAHGHLAHAPGRSLLAILEHNAQPRQPLTDPISQRILAGLAQVLAQFDQ